MHRKIYGIYWDNTNQKSIFLYAQKTEVIKTSSGPAKYLLLNLKLTHFSEVVYFNCYLRWLLGRLFSDKYSIKNNQCFVKYTQLAFMYVHRLYVYCLSYDMYLLLHYNYMFLSLIIVRFITKFSNWYVSSLLMLTVIVASWGNIYFFKVI